jgi:hypothetical protein
MASTVELADIATAWREWAAHPDGWISVLHGEILIRVESDSSSSSGSVGTQGRRG